MSTFGFSFFTKPWAIARLMHTVKLMFPSIEGHDWDKNLSNAYKFSATAVSSKQNNS
jgi:hypothetical protein